MLHLLYRAQHSVKTKSVDSLDSSPWYVFVCMCACVYVCVCMCVCVCVYCSVALCTCSVIWVSVYSMFYVKNSIMVCDYYFVQCLCLLWVHSSLTSSHNQTTFQHMEVNGVWCYMYRQLMGTRCLIINLVSHTSCTMWVQIVLPSNSTLVLMRMSQSLWIRLQ